MDELKQSDRPTWKIRRRIIFGSLLFCAFIVLFVLMKPVDSTIGETAITMAFFLAASVIGSYVFGAAWEDISKK